MKRILSIVTALMMVGVFCFFDSSLAYGAEQDLGTIGDPEPPQSLQQEQGTEDYMPNAALVMFKTTDKLSKTKAKSTLRSGLNKVGDLTVDNLWSFESEGHLAKNSQGIRKITKNTENRYDTVVLVRSATLSTPELVKRLNARKDVRYAEPNYRIKALSISNDPYSDYQWSMRDGEETPNVSYEWNTNNVCGSDSIVAVVDTGIDYTHPDLKDNMWENSHYPKLKGECGYDFIKGDADPMDENGHGTHCAGIIGASGDNGIGISGVNKNIKLMALRILDEDGSAWMSHEIAAYNYINIALDLKEPVKAINNSWGGGDDSDIFRTLVDIVGEKGAITVCAAGNENNNNDEYEDYPACIDSPYLISVAATKEDGKLVSFSNYGEKTVDVAAPGTDILSSVSYYSYNPTIYGNKQGDVSDHFNDYEGDETWGLATEEDIYLNGVPYSEYAAEQTDPKKVEITVQKGQGGFLNKNGADLEMTLKNLKAEDLVCLTIPYEISRSASIEPVFSVMAQADSPEMDFGDSILGFLDTEQGTTLDIETLENEPLVGTYLSGKEDYWDHFTVDCLEDEDLQELISKAGDPDADEPSTEAPTDESEGDGTVIENPEGDAAGAGEPSTEAPIDESEGDGTVTENPEGDTAGAGEPSTEAPIDESEGDGTVTENPEGDSAGAGEPSSINPEISADDGDGDPAEEEPKEETSQNTDPLKREIVILVYAADAGDFTVRLDDMGLSRQNLSDEKEFGKYDFMSGTSMAAPYISGAVALKNAELGQDIDAEVLVNETVSLAKDTPKLPVIQKSSFDFSKRPAELGPRIGKVTVNTDKKTVTIKGSGLNPSTGISIEIGNDESSLQPVAEADIIGQSDREVTIKDNRWINNIKTIRVTGFAGKQNIRDDIYLVKGKKTYTKDEDFDVDFGDAIATNGKIIYSADSSSRSIRQINPRKWDDYDMESFDIDPAKLFKGMTDKNAQYTMLFGSDLAYSKGMLYNVIEYGQYDTPESDDDEFIIFNNYAVDESISSSGNDGDASPIYSGDLRLVSIKANSGVTKNLGKLPADLESTVDWTMAAYNGKLYFIGGYSCAKDTKGFSRLVKIYDPVTKKWSKGPALPEGRAGGKALQSGNKLIYTLGYSEAQNGTDPMDQKYPANLIFDGKKWTVSKVGNDKAIEPLAIEKTVVRGGNSYIASTGNISLTKGGIVYTGIPAVDYGDTFKYDVAKDAFEDTGYNFITRLDADEIKGIAVGNQLFGTYDSVLYKMPVASGLISITAPKKTGGSVTGTGTFVPGSSTTIKVKTAKYYEIKSLYKGKTLVKAAKGKRSYSLALNPLTVSQKITANFQKYKVKITVKKKGKGTVTGAKTYTAGTTAKITAKAAKGYVIKSVYVGKKAMKVKKNAKSYTFSLKKLTKGYKVTVNFQKKKK